METLRKRTRLAGWSMMAGGLAMTVPPFLGPPNGADDTRQRLADLAANPTPTVAKSLVFQAAVLLILPGVAAIVGRTVGRGSATVISGGVVYGAGLVGAFGFLLMSGIEVAVAGNGPISATLVDAADRMGSSPAAIPTFVLALLCFHLVGLPWLTFGMVRARQIPWWLATVCTIGTAFAFFGSGTKLEAVGWIVLGLAIAAVGSTIARPAVLARRTPAPAEAQPA
ncbi:hypothetical protein [Kribbella sp. NBC_00359]|uniref:hypothetical protein n=1 Tax=Kribbella sp. NBC_00359 TaxID=2975966 RepID=UPI002E1B404D